MSLIRAAHDMLAVHLTADQLARAMGGVVTTQNPLFVGGGSSGTNPLGTAGTNPLYKV